MGWNVSMIIIQNPSDFKDEKAILKALGMEGRKYACTTTLDECIYPYDESINIGYYNGCIVICDDFQLSGKLIMEESSEEASAISELFPDSEILTVSCLSSINFHGYSLIKNGKQIRAKSISAESADYYINTGELLEEEKAIYDGSILRHNKHYWVDGDSEYEENQLMENFSFGVAKRLLGVEIDANSGEELLFNTVFQKYEKA